VDHFQIVRCLGRGGMGVVYLARDTKLGRRVALKLVDPALARSAEAVSLFLREARATARFSHPHIVTIHAVGQHGEVPYIALEYLEGQTLHQRMAEQPLGPKQAIRICLAVAEALREAHANQIVHGDLKPANVVIPADGRPRVVDFGVCRVIDPRAASTPSVGPDLAEAPLAPGGDPRLTTVVWLEAIRRPGVVGTPAYMSPEQWAGKPVTGAADIWALGLIIGEAVARWHPYDRLLTTRASLSVLREAVISPKTIALPGAMREELAPELAALITACLAKEPSERPTAAALCEALEAVLSDGATSSPGLETAAPFPGLMPFAETQARFFFGREAETAAFIERLRVESVLPVVGPTGVGKSSFIHAGVIPRLREEGRWLVIDFRPGADPFGALAERVLAVTEPELGEERRESSASSRALWRELASSPPLLALKLRALAHARDCRVLLFVDQLEEVVACTDVATRHAFLEAIGAAADDHEDPLRVVFALRDDFLPVLAETPRARASLAHVTVLCPPGAAELETIATRPLAAVGYEFDDATLPQDLTGELLGRPACLPLLALAVRMLWERRDRRTRSLRRSAYEQVGGVAGALALHAEAVFEGLAPQRRELARHLLLRLVSPGGTGLQVVPKGRLLEGLGEGALELLGELTRARLLSVHEGGEGGVAGVTLVHDGILQSWPRLARWVTESREELRFLDDVTRAANLWLSRGRRAEEAWEAEALADAERSLACASSPIPPQVQEFVEAGRLRARRRRRRRLALLGLALGLLGAAATGAGLGAWAVTEKAREARHDRDLARRGWAEAQREGARAALLNGSLLEARSKLRLALEAHDSPAARMLWRRLRQHPLRFQRPLGAILYDVAVSPDGGTLAAASLDHAVYLVDTATAELRVLRGHRDQVFSVAFSPRGGRIATGSLNGEILVFTGEGRLEARLVAERPVRSLAIDPAGRLLAAAGGEGSVRLWDLDSRAEVAHERGHRGVVESVCFSPDGRLLASAGFDRTVRISDPRAGTAPRVLTGHALQVNSVAFSPDGRELASASDDRTVRIWSLASGQTTRILAGGDAPLRRVRFSPDGRVLAAAGLGGGIRLWLRTGAELPSLSVADGVLGLGFGPRGSLLAAGGLDGVVRLFEVDAAAVTRPAPHTRSVNAVALSPDGRTIASGSTDSTVRLWSSATGEVTRVLRGHRDQVYSLAFAPDGSRLASASWDGTVRIWSLSGGIPPRVLAGHQGAVTAVSFDPDGKTLVSGGRDRTARLWDLASGRERRVLAGHTDAVTAVALAEGLIATASHDGSVRIFAEGEAPLAVLPLAERPHGLALSADGRELATAAWDGSVRRCSIPPRLEGVGEASATLVAPPSCRVVGRHGGRAYRVALAPDGAVLSVGADGALRVWPEAGGERFALRGHRGEVNDVAVSADGALAVSGGDDGTVRTFRLATGAPHWHAAGIVGNPPQLASQRGWLALEGGARARGESGWERAALRSAQSAASDDGIFLCLLERQGVLELWDTRSGVRLLREKVGPPPLELKAVPVGCLSLAPSGERGAGGRASLHRPERAPRELARDATAIGWGDDAILVAAGEQVRFHDGEGTLLRALPLPGRAVQLARDRTRLVVGLADGRMVVLRDPAGSAAPLLLRDVPSSSPTVLRLGPTRETVSAGFENGLLGIWSLQSGERLELRAELQGALRSIAVHPSGRVHAASELGGHLSLELGELRVPYCQLVREVWARIPTVWEDGLPVMRGPPAGHACLR
jgi:WD40 repeat protein